MARLQERYQKEIVPALKKKLGRDNIHSIPKLEKIVVNMGVGKALQDKNRMEQSAEQLGQITGQRAQIRKARLAVSGFRLREGNEIGCRVTLRGRRMYEFLDRLISIALPRIRDFRGVKPMTPRERIRVRLRCKLCGRPRAVYRKFGICRICFRNMASEGLIPGVKKASW